MNKINKIKTILDNYVEKGMLHYCKNNDSSECYEYRADEIGTLCKITINSDGTHKVDFEPLMHLFRKYQRKNVLHLIDTHITENYSFENPDDCQWSEMDQIAKKYIQAFLNKNAIIKTLLLHETHGIYYYADEAPKDYEIIDLDKIMQLFQNNDEKEFKKKHNLKDLDYIRSLDTTFYDAVIYGLTAHEILTLNDSCEITGKYLECDSSIEIIDMVEVISKTFGENSIEYSMLETLLQNNEMSLGDELSSIIYNHVNPEDIDYVNYHNLYEEAIIKQFKHWLNKQLKKFDNISIEQVKFNISLSEAYDALPNIIKNKISEDISRGYYNSDLIINIIASFKKICKRKDKTPVSSESILQCLKNKSENYQIETLLSTIFSVQTQTDTSTKHRKH